MSSLETPLPLEVTTTDTFTDTQGAPSTATSPDNAERREFQEDIWQEVQGRIYEVNRASSHSAQEDAFLAQRLGFINRQAQLFFRYHIPSWPPRFLLRKLIRKLMVPLLMPQADFNEATRDVLAVLWERAQTSSIALRASEATISELNDQISQMHEQMGELRQQLTALQTQQARVSTASAFNATGTSRESEKE